jgi:hypothetical protein
MAGARARPSKGGKGRQPVTKLSIEFNEKEKELVPFEQS